MRRLRSLGFLLLSIAWIGRAADPAPPAAPKAPPKASAPRPPVPSKQTVEVAMKDGVKLATDIYVPAAGGSFPVVLIRTPYNKNALTNQAGEAIRHGYAFVGQDCRGRYASAGENLPFSGETISQHQDGLDTLHWIRQQPWCNGKVGTLGGSATGITQIWMGQTEEEGPDAQHISVAPDSFFQDFVFPGGIFKKHLLEFWITSQKFLPAAMSNWRSHPTLDAYWKNFDASQVYKRFNAPAVHIGGYYDLFAPGTVKLFNGIQQFGGPRARGNQKLVLGPWTHAVQIEYSGDLRFPGAARPTNVVSDPWRWFDHFLKGATNGIEKLPAVTYYVMGDISDPRAPGKVWKTADQWPPPAREEEFFLTPIKSLDPKPQLRSGSIAIAHDPRNPAPTVGGLQFFSGITAGTKDQRLLEARLDAAVFTSAPLQEPLEMTGEPSAELWVSSTARDADLFVKVCDVYPDGRSYNLSEGELRLSFAASYSRPEPLTPNEPRKYRIALSPTSVVLNRGHRISVIVTGSSFPGFEPNPLPSVNTIHMGDQHLSKIVLPINRPR